MEHTPKFIMTKEANVNHKKSVEKCFDDHEYDDDCDDADDDFLMENSLW